MSPHPEQGPAPAPGHPGALPEAPQHLPVPAQGSAPAWHSGAARGASGPCSGPPVLALQSPSRPPAPPPGGHRGVPPSLPFPRLSSPSSPRPSCTAVASCWALPSMPRSVVLGGSVYFCIPCILDFKQQ